jgi:hypothetical protein
MGNKHFQTEEIDEKNMKRRDRDKSLSAVKYLKKRKCYVCNISCICLKRFVHTYVYLFKFMKLMMSLL